MRSSPAGRCASAAHDSPPLRSPIRDCVTRYLPLPTGAFESRAPRCRVSQSNPAVSRSLPSEIRNGVPEAARKISSPVGQYRGPEPCYGRPQASASLPQSYKVNIPVGPRPVRQPCESRAPKRTFALTMDQLTRGFQSVLSTSSFESCPWQCAESRRQKRYRPAATTWQPCLRDSSAIAAW
jgi:hypothetical protein